MKSNIMMKFSFMTIIFIWFTLCTANDNQIFLELPNYMNESESHLCKNEIISLNFANATITSIGQNFISNPWITCLNLMNTRIRSIKKGAFDKLPNLTQLILSNNEIDMKELFYFGGHESLKILILNSATQYNYGSINILEEYPNLEILSVRRNHFTDLQTSMDETPFPKLEILDLSSNSIQGTNFMKLLPESLYLLDLHDNSLNSLVFDKKQVNLLILNLNNNNFKFVKKNNDSHDHLLCNSHDPYNQYNHHGHRSKMYHQNDQYNSHNFLMMTGLEKLHYLSLSGNKIDFIESNTFEDTNELVYLNLSRNQIIYLHSEIFAQLQSLRSLDLSFNQFENVPLILNKTVISILSLNCNNIKNIISNAFVQMPKLTKLLLGGNQIDEIHAKAFADLSLLEILDLSRNKLSFLPERLSESLISLKYLNLNGNKFASIESLSLMTNALTSMEVDIAMNPLEYLDVSYLKSLPQNLTLNLMQKSNSAHGNFYECRTK